MAGSHGGTSKRHDEIVPAVCLSWAVVLAQQGTDELVLDVVSVVVVEGGEKRLGVFGGVLSG